MKNNTLPFSVILLLFLISCKREVNNNMKYKKVNGTSTINRIEEEQFFKDLFLEKYDFFINLFADNFCVDELTQRDYFSRKEFNVNNTDYFFEIIGNNKEDDALIYRYLDGDKKIIYKLKDPFIHLVDCSTLYYNSYTWLEQKSKKDRIFLYTISFSDYFTRHYYQKVELVFKNTNTTISIVTISEDPIDVLDYKIDMLNFNNTYKFKYEVINSFSENLLGSNFER